MGFNGTEQSRTSQLRGVDNTKAAGKVWFKKGRSLEAHTMLHEFLGGAGNGSRQGCLGRDSGTNKRSSDNFEVVHRRVPVELVQVDQHEAQVRLVKAQVWAAGVQIWAAQSGKLGLLWIMDFGLMGFIPW